MSFHQDHELHKRRKSRNIGLGLSLGALVLLIAAISAVKFVNTEIDPALSGSTALERDE